METPLTPSFIDTIKELVHESTVKFFVLGSLLLQVLLLFLATYRKRTSNPLVPYIVFGVHDLSCTVADVAFYFTVVAKWVSPDQMPFGLWAAFMLLHLAGQECLTACSLDDYKDGAWLKFFKSTVWRYAVHFLAGMHRGGCLPLVKFSIFSIAIIRLFARTLRLLLAMWEVNRSREHPLLDPFLLSLEDDHEQQSLPSSNNQHGLEQDLEQPSLFSSNNQHGVEQSSASSSACNLHCVLRAHCLLKSSLRTIADHIPQHSPSLFHTGQTHSASKIKAEQAMKIVEVELNFIYDSFYTDGIIRRYLGCKNYLIYAGLSSYASLCCAITVIMSVSLYTREHYSAADYNATCILLWGTLILEVLSYLMMVFSDWTIASLGEEYGGHVLLSIAPHKQHWLSELGWTRHLARVIFRQWSDTIPTLNYLDYLMKQPAEKLKYHMRDLVLSGESTERYTDELRGFIFNKLQSLLNKPQNLANDSQGIPNDHFSSSRRKLLNSSPMDVFSLHIATEILYRAVDQEQCPDRKYSKLLSDYVAYLLTKKPQFFGGEEDVGFKEIKEALTLIKKIGASEDLNQCLQTFWRSIGAGEDFNQRLQTFWRGIRSLKVTNEWTGDMVNVIEEVITSRNGDGNVTHIQWNVISERWIGLLLHAAIKCDPIEHVKELGQGGQLVSHFWLLALHFGFSSFSSEK